ncbi:protein atonal homolog 7-A [Xenopus laevis]|uniref:Transcription factor Atoh7-a n=3 Tax=Xenopus laevis TaxID=8355 RepID=ATO7A_XENLA|nr:transcription factor Atoh7-a [Xenopus laevis]O13125.1 RecName: Full=Transcription factor Atoh7-a; AltName: Full=Atonal bHLH transcription factor 7-A; AltName: Full=Helix-loop-helix protein xATH-5-A; AltName: Full=Protein atonal homolog 5-A; Short=xAth5-A; AltName: Full=Protein atonal homolog 7-A [Xenopus laevis]AAB58668.1 atonal homolog 5a [Xenopus laevis]AAI69965.1 Atonal homolog 5a [Xenopus laevis]AAI69967.1 Atonal homolog 5a [Xenopus laevis]OCT70084.1 hypothetical protein XELAEV_18037005
MKSDSPVHRESHTGCQSPCPLRCLPARLEGSTKRRLAANARERRRMQGLNTAFDSLRKVVPQWGEDKQLSKYETLQMALSYIMALSRILSEAERYSRTDPEEWTNIQYDHIEEEQCLSYMEVRCPRDCDRYLPQTFSH